MTPIIQLLNEMKCLAAEIHATKTARDKISADGQRFGSKPHEISAMIQDANLIIKSLIKQYQAISVNQFGLMRDEQCKLMGAGKPVPESKGAGLALTEHNSDLIIDLLNAA